jgi:hypothetical protein
MGFDPAEYDEVHTSVWAAFDTGGPRGSVSEMAELTEEGRWPRDSAIAPSSSQDPDSPAVRGACEASPELPAGLCRRGATSRRCFEMPIHGAMCY